MLKKILALFLLSLFSYVLVSCSDNEGETTNNMDATFTEETSAAETSSEEASEEVSSESTSDPVKTATLTVEQVDDIAGEFGAVFNASAEEYAFYAVFRSDVKITDVKVLGLTFVDADENGNVTFDREVLYAVDEIGPDFNLAVHLTAEGSIPAYGISYIDTDGIEKAFSVNMSGEDGLLYLSEIE